MTAQKFEARLEDGKWWIYKLKNGKRLVHFDRNCSPFIITRWLSFLESHSHGNFVHQTASLKEEAIVSLKVRKNRIKKIARMLQGEIEFKPTEIKERFFVFSETDMLTEQRELSIIVNAGISNAVE